MASVHKSKKSNKNTYCSILIFFYFSISLSLNISKLNLDLIKKFDTENNKVNHQMAFSNHKKS